ncbi:unnamed protein product [Linum trigynum]|uniref:F-box protein At3g26010-like beta-propeller domain-containing protein n=1 Tax=Linum trigynum TaxID=586398 RepID=A0AAV2FJA7_9ROSI
MTISNLGDDLLVEILILSFPNPRSACRSKSVCKRWKTLISSPRFNRRFVSHHQSINEPKPPILVASNDPESVIRGFLPTPAPSANRYGRPQPFIVFDSFDDLLLCGFAEAGEIRSHDEIFRSYLLCNPFTKQWVALPLAPERPVGYKSLVPSLVCDSNINLDLGDGQVFTHSSDYRFRVVCMYQHNDSTKLDVFCSEIGEWMKEALVLDGILKPPRIDIVSCNGAVFLSYLRAQASVYEPCVVAINPFRLDAPPTPIDVTTPLFDKQWSWNISVSKGALHMIVYEDHGTTLTICAGIVLSVWRLDDGDHLTFWRKVCEGPVRLGNFRLPSMCFVAALHPEKPEIVFFQHLDSGPEGGQLSCNLGTGGEIEFVSELQYFLRWRMFQSKVYCWYTPIPRYQVLRGMYDGSYSCWVQGNNEIDTPFIKGTHSLMDNIMGE